MRGRICWLVAALALSAPAIAHAQVRAPRLAVQTLEALPQPLAAPYRPGADAKAEVAAAFARARKSGKRVLIDFGANWCVDCRVLAEMLELPEMRRWAPHYFEIVQVHVGRFDRNLDIAARYGVGQLEALPALLVIDPRTGKLLNRGQIIALGEASLMQPQQMADLLAKWAQ